MVKITLIRHGQSVVNENPNLAPELRINAGLSTTGILQAKQLKFNFDLLIITPVKRSIQTYTNSDIKVANICMHDVFRELMDDSANFLELEQQKLENMQQLEVRVDQAIILLRQIIGTVHDSKQESEQLIQDEPESNVNSLDADSLIKVNKYNSIGIISHFQFLKIFTKKVIGKEILFGNCQTFTLDFN
jgi:hypothetical protein